MWAAGRCMVKTGGIIMSACWRLSQSRLLVGVHSFIMYSFIHSLLCPSNHPSTRSFVRLFVRSFVRLFVHSFMHVWQMPAEFHMLVLLATTNSAAVMCVAILY